MQILRYTEHVTTDTEVNPAGNHVLHVELRKLGSEISEELLTALVDHFNQTVESVLRMARLV